MALSQQTDKACRRPERVQLESGGDAQQRFEPVLKFDSQQSAPDHGTWRSDLWLASRHVAYRRKTVQQKMKLVIGNLDGGPQLIQQASGHAATPETG